MNSDNWVVQNLVNALDTWNEKLAEIWQIITQSPETFKGGGIWNAIVGIHGALQAIGYALLVLFFVIGVMKTCGSFAEIKRPEQALKLFIRFALAKGVVTHGLELMMALFKIVQGVISTIMRTAGFGSMQRTVLPSEIVVAVEECGFFESIPLWAVTLIGSLFITVLSFVMIMSVYGRFFRLYLYTAIAPIDLLEGAGFKMYLKSQIPLKEDGTYDFENATPVGIGDYGETELFTGEDGSIFTYSLPYGTYVVVESTTPEKTMTVEPFEVQIVENSPKQPQVWKVLTVRYIEEVPEEPTDEPDETPTEEPKEEPIETPTEKPVVTPEEVPTEQPTEITTPKTGDNTNYFIWGGAGVVALIIVLLVLKRKGVIWK